MNTWDTKLHLLAKSREQVQLSLLNLVPLFRSKFVLIQGNCGFREAVSEVLVVSVQSPSAVVVVTVSSKRFQQLHSSLLVGGLVKVVWIIIRPSFFFSFYIERPCSIILHTDLCREVCRNKQVFILSVAVVSDHTVCSWYSLGPFFSRKPCSFRELTRPSKSIT